MKKKVEVMRTKGFNDIEAVCDGVGKFESNIELNNPVLNDKSDKEVETLLIPLHSIDQVLIEADN